MNLTYKAIQSVALIIALRAFLSPLDILVKHERPRSIFIVVAEIYFNCLIEL